MMKFITILDTILNNIARLAFPAMVAIIVFSGEPSMADALRQAYLDWSGVAEESVAE